MTATEGFKPSAQLRETMEVAEVAKATRRETKADIANKEAGLAFLAKVPDEVANNPEALRAHIAAGCGDPDKPKPKGKVKPSDEDKKKAAEELVWKSLQVDLGERSLDRAEMVQMLNAALPPLREKLADIESKIDDQIKAAKAAKAEYAAYEVLIKHHDLKLALFEKDRTKVAPRAIEEDLAELKKKLAKFKDAPVETVLPCAALTAFVDELEQEVDHLAHRAKCNVCTTENGVPRTAEAKALINAKVEQLVALAGQDAAGPSPQDQADFALAKALDAMRNTVGEDGKKGGKMLGVLMCTNADGQPVMLYGYSGTLYSNSRVIYAQIAAIEAKRTIPKKIEAKEAELEIKAKELADKRVAVADLEETVAQQKAAAKAAAEQAAAEKAAAEQAAAEKAAAEKAAAEKEVAAEEVAAEEGAEIVVAEKPAAADVVAEKVAEKVAETKEAVRLAKDKKNLARIEKEHATVKEALEELKAARLTSEQITEQLAAANRALIDAGRLDTAAESATAALWARAIPPTGALRSLGGATQSLAALALDHEGTPHGVCSAPKMIQAAKAQNLKIVGMAEAWFGEGANTHGELVASCATCMKNIGFQLCENCHA